MSSPDKKVDERVLNNTRNKKEPARNVTSFSGFSVFFSKRFPFLRKRSEATFTHFSLFGLESALVTVLMLIIGGNENQKKSPLISEGLVYATKINTVLTPPPPPGIEIHIDITSGADDAEEEGATGTNPGTIHTGESRIELVNDATSPVKGDQYVGLRFNGVNIPQGAIITSASLNVNSAVATFPNTNSGATSLTIFAEDSDNAPAIATTPFYLSTRTSTSASVEWSPNAWGFSFVSSPDISAVIQELVNRSGWTSSSSVLLIMSGTGSRTFSAFEDSGISGSAFIQISYTTETRDCTNSGELLVAKDNFILRYDQNTGTEIDTFIYSTFEPSEMIMGPDNYLYISDIFLDDIKRYDITTGAYIDVFADGSDGLLAPNGLTFGPDGNLYVNNSGGDEVLYFDPATGNLLGTFVSSGSGGLNTNEGGLEFGPDGNLYVASRLTREVLRYNGTTGAFIDVFVSAGSGGLFDPRDITFGPDGNLYVTSTFPSSVFRYNGTTGAFIDEFVTNGSGGLNTPLNIAFGPDGNLFVSSSIGPTDEVLKYNGTTGAFISTFTSTVNSGRGLYFAPVPACPELCSNGFDDDNDGAIDSADSDCASLDADLCYLIADGISGAATQDVMYTLNPSTGALTEIGATGAYKIEAMAIDPVNEIIYACNGDTVGIVNPVTATFTPISGAGIGTVDGGLGSLGVSDIDGLTFDTIANVLWASERHVAGNDFIFQINPATGDFIPDAFGAGIDYLEVVTPEGDLDDLALGSDGTLYVISNDGGSGNQRIGVVDKSTGAYTELGDPGIQDLEGLAFTQSGQLFGTTGSGGDNDDSFFTTDPGTSESTILYDLSPAIDVEACDCNHVAFINGIIGNYVWADLNSDGIQDAGEPGVENVQINLLDKLGNPVLDGGGAAITTLTDQLGYYEFNRLAADTFMVEVIPPSGATISPKGAGTTETDNDINPGTGISDSIFLVTGLIRNNTDIGLLNIPVTQRVCADGGELFIASESGSIIRFDQSTGTEIDTFMVGLVEPMEMLVGPDGYLYVSDENLNQIRRYSLVTGAFVDVFATGLYQPDGMTIGPDGNLYVNNRSTDEVVYFDFNTGANLGTFVTTGSGGLNSNKGGLEFGPDGNLYISSRSTDQILRYNGTTGAFIDVFVSAGSGGLGEPTDIAFGPDDNLYVTNFLSDNVIRYNGTTGAFIDEFVTSGIGGLNNPGHLSFGSDGYLYVSAISGSDGVFRFDGTTGAFVDVFVSGLTNPQGMLLAPVPGCPEICNNNFDDDSDGLVDCADPDCPGPAMILTGTTSVCEGGTMILRDNGTDATSWSWTGPNGFTETVKSFAIGSVTAANYAGVYYLTISDGGFCTTTDSITVTINPLPTATATANTPLCEGENLILNEEGGDGVSWTWSGPSGASSNSKSFGVGNVDSDNAGVYSVTVTDVNSCTRVSTVSVSVNAEPTATVGSNSPICTGADINLTESGGDAVNWSWTGPNSFSSTDQNPTITGATALAAGNYLLTITDANDCTTTASTTVSLVANPTATAGSNSPICIGADLNLTESGGAAVSWSWSGPNSFTSTDQNPTITGATALVNGIYTVTIIDTNSCTSTTTTTVTINANPTVTTGSNSPVCTGTGLDLTESGGVAVSWSWSGPNSFTSSLQNPTINTVTALADGDYTVIITDVNNCTSTSTVSVDVVTSPDITAGSNEPICIGEDLNLTESGGAAVSWSWSGPNSFSSTDQNPTINTVTALADGDYSIEITDAGGCTISATVTVNIDTLPTVNLVFADDEDCVNNTIFTLSGGTPSGGTYSGTGVSGGNFNATAAGIGAHVITYSFTDGEGCNNTTTDVLNVINPGTGTLTLPIDEACVTSTILALSGGTPSGGTFSGPGVSGTNFDPSLAGPGVHEITYTFTDVNSCENTATDNIIVHNIPTLNLDFSDKEDCILNSTFTLNEGLPAGGTYSGTGVTGTNFDASAAGLGVHYITYTYTDANTCTNSIQDSIEVVAIPTVSLMLDSTIACVSSTALPLSGGTPSGGTYSGTGVAGTTFNPMLAGAGTHTITYSYTDANGCNNTATEDIEVFTEPSILGIATSNPTTCGGTNGSITVSINGGTGSYEYRIDGGTWQASNVFSTLATGDYDIDFRNDNGTCVVDYGTVSLTDPTSPTAEINLPADGCLNAASSFTATDAGFGASYNWDFGSGASPATATGIGPHAVTYGSNGSKTVALTVTRFGCTGTDSENHTVNALPAVSLVLPDSEECISSTSLTLSNGTPSGGTYSGTAVTGTNFDGAAAGVGSHTITYTYTDGNGCVNTATDDIEVLALPTLSFTLGTDQACISDITLALNGGSPSGGTYSGTAVSGTNFNPSLAGVGNYTITYSYTDGKGCNNTITDAITVYDFPSIDVVNPTDPTTCGGNEGSISVTASGGTGSFEYRLNSGSWQASNSFTNLTAGDYILRIRNANDFCELIYPSTITLSDPPATIVNTNVTSNYTGQDISCVGASDGFAEAIGSGGLAPYSYIWSDGQTGNTLENVAAGTYTVTATDANSCQGVGTVTLNDPPALGVTAIYTNPTCYGDSDGAIDVTAIGGVGAYTYAWNDLSPIAFWPMDGTTDDISGNGHHAMSILGDEDYSNDAVDGNQSFDFDGDTGIEYDDAPFLLDTFSYRTVIMSVKAKDDDEKYMLYDEGGSNEGIALVIDKKKLRGAVTSGFNMKTAISMDLPDDYDEEWVEVGFIYDNGIFSLSVNGVQGTTVNTGHTSINIDPNSTHDSGLGLSFGTNAFQNYSYKGYEGLMDNVSVYDSAFEPQQIADINTDGGDRTGIPAGDYLVYVYDLNGCIDSVSLTLTQPDSLELTATVTDILCNGQSNGEVDLTVAGGTTPYSYNWSTGSATQDISSLLPGTYSVTITDINLCVAEGSFVVNEPQVLTSTTTVNAPYGGYQISCVGASDGNGRVTPTGGVAPYTYLWSNGQTNSNLTNVTDGNYTVTVTDANGCTTINNITVTDPPAISVNTAVISNLGGEDISCTGASDGRARVTPVTGVIPYNSFVWSNGATGAILNNVTAGTYTVTATDGNGCTVIGSVTLADPPGTTLTTVVTSDFNGADISCAGETDGAAEATATPSSGRTIISYTWSNGQTGTTLTGVGAGTYTVTVTDSENCTTTETVTLINPGSLAASINKTSNYNGTEVSCTGGADGEATVNVIGGVTPYTYAWTNGETTSTVSNFTPGTHSVTVTDANGCTTTSTTSFSEPSAMTLTGTSAPPSDCGNADGIILMTAAGGVGTFEYSIDGVNYQSSNAFTGLTAGTYFGYVRNDFGTCVTGPVAIIVEIPEAPTINNITIINPTTSSSNDGGILIAASGNGIAIEYSLDGSTWQSEDLFSGLGEGPVSIQVKYVTSTTCIATTTATLVAGAGVVGSGGGESFCSGDQSGVNFVETYYLPFPEDQILNSLSTIWASSCGGATVADPVATYVSIGIVEDGTILYYDHWEDSFELNLSFPIQPTTEIWGDGDLTNGVPPGYAVDILNAADIIILDNDVVSTTRQGVIDFDGGDKIGSRGNLSVTRLGWASGPNFFLAGALEVYSTGFWGTNYKIPVGENTDVHSLFEYTGAVIMAKEDNTTINIDLSPATTTIVTVTIDEGESYLVNGGLGSDGLITSDKDVQVHLITGDICHSYESRWFTLKPTDNWSDSYFNPVATVNDGGDTHIDFVNAPTYVHVYNPNPTTITVSYDSKDGFEDSRAIDPGETWYFELDNNSGTHFYSTGNEPFYAIATIDSDEFANNARNDWGFSLTPESALSSQITLVGFAPGANPKITTSENSAPVWLTADYPSGSTSTGPITVCVDYNGDGGANPDLNGIFYDVSYDINPLENEKIYDPDGDQTGMRLWVCDGSDGIIAGAWGQEPSAVGNEGQAIDLGVGLPNGIPFAAAKCVDLSKDYNSNGKYDECDEVIYSIEIRNSGVLPLSIGSLNIIDTLPAEVSYIPNSTSTIVSGVVSDVSDDGGAASPFPIDENGFVYNAVIQPGDSLILRFEASINDIPSAQFVTNQAHIYSGTQDLLAEVSFPVEDPVGLELYGIPPDTTVSCSAVPTPPTIGTEIYATNNCEDIDTIAQAGWTVEYVSSQETVMPGNTADLAFDEDPSTYWHTQYSGSSPAHPHELHIDLGAIYQLSGFRYLPRQDNIAGRIEDYELYVTEDLSDWGTPQSSGTFVDGTDEEEVIFNVKFGRYVRLVSNSALDGGAFTAVAELELLQCVNHAQDTIIFSEVSIQTSDGSSTDDCYEITRTWEGTDHCGQMSTYTQTLTVIDTVAPLLFNVPTDIVVSSSTIPDAPLLNCVGPGNLALSKPVSQSSIASGGDANRAVDGNTNGNFGAGSVAQTNNEFQPWWEVDLQDVSDIDDIEVWNRTDCCAADLSNYYILISDVPFVSTDLATTLGDVNVTSFFQTASAGSPTTINIDTTARYVRVQLQGTAALNLTEIVVIPTCISATDDCDPDVNITFTESTSSGTCTSSITRTWTATDNCGNTTTRSQLISIDFVVESVATVTSDYNGADISCATSSDGTATVTVSGAAAPVVYNWSNGQTTANAIGLSAGTYYVTATDNNGCTAQDSVVIQAPPTINIAATITSDYNGSNVSCTNATDGSANVIASGGIGALNYLWSTGETTTSAVNLLAGKYIVTVTDVNGCIAMDSVTLVDPTPVDVTAAITSDYNGEDISCPNDNDGEAEATATGGTGSINYSWSNSETTSTITGLIAGTYTVSATDANGCLDTDAVTLTDPTSIVTSITASSNPTTCGGTEGSITAAAIGGSGTYEYRLNAGAWQASNVFTGLGAGTYNLFVRNSDGTCEVGPREVILIDAIPQSCPILTDTTLVCNTNVNLVLQTVPSPGATGYTWTVPAGAILVSGQGTDSIVVDLDSIPVGSYNVCMVTNSACGDSPACCLSLDVIACTEICNNGIDDDEDGLLDCLDPDCDFTATINLAANNCVGDIVSISTDSLGDVSTYTWNFGADVTPATATGFGPHDVTYGAAGLKYVTVDIDLNGCSLSLLDSTTIDNCVASMGDFVWQDDDGDGIQDMGEPGIEGVTVSLYDNSNTLVASTTTASDGSFIFNSIGLGTYYLVFDVSTNVSGITLYEGTLRNIGSPLTDSDANQATGRTALFLFDPGLGNIFTLDAGFILSCPPSQGGGVDVNRR